jgi:hypothetical protein
MRGAAYVLLRLPRTNSSASSIARSALLIAAFRGSPVVVLISSILLGEVGLHQLQLGFVAAEAFGACIGVDEVGHGCGFAVFV